MTRSSSEHFPPPPPPTANLIHFSKQTPAADTTIYLRQRHWWNQFNAKLSPKRYWRGPRSQKVETISNTALSPPQWCFTKASSDISHPNVTLINCEGQSHKMVSISHNFWRERRAEAVSNRGPSAHQPEASPPGHSISNDWGRCLSRIKRTYDIWVKMITANEKQHTWFLKMITANEWKTTHVIFVSLWWWKYCERL